MMFGSVCSGIEAASVAWNGLDWKAAWFAEIEPFPCAVLAHHYPDVPNLGDMSKLPGRVLSGEIEAPDVFCGGTPCQAFSVAGLRRSLDDARGNLSLVFCEIADAIDTVRLSAGDEPSIIFWENVPGVLSTSDNAFGCFLAGLAGEDDPLEPPGGKWTNAGYVLGPQRAVAWRVTDAQYFGVAQRRRRVFVVASAREGFDPAAVLFESEGMRRDTPPSREAGEGVAGGFARSVALRGREGGATAELGDDLQNCLRASSGGGDKPHVITMAHGQGVDLRNGSITGDVAHTVQAGQHAPDPGGTPHALQPIVVHGTQDPCVSEHTAFALGRNNGGENAIAFSCKDHGGDAGPISPTLRSMGHDGSHANAGGQVAVAFAQNSRDEVRLMNGDGQIVGALAAEPGMKQTCYVAEPVAVRHTSPTITSNYGKQVDSSDTALGPNVVFPAMQVRRLTPRECERLQGFQWRCSPDYPGAWQDEAGHWWSPDYTLIPTKQAKKIEAQMLLYLRMTRPDLTMDEARRLAADGPRYKALGNSWAVPNVRWIGERIQKEIRK